MKSIPHNPIFLFLAVILLCAGPAQAETIHLKSGLTIEGTIIERTEDSIKVDTGLGIPVTYYLDEIENIANTGVINPTPDLQPEIIPTSEPETTPPADVEPAPVATPHGPAAGASIQTPKTSPAPAPASAPSRRDVASLPPWQAPRLSRDEYLQLQAERARALEQERINGTVLLVIEPLSLYWQKLKDTYPLIRNIAESPAGLAIAAIIWIGIYAAICYPLMLLSRRLQCDGGMSWVPIFQIFQMLRIAGKPPVWFLFLCFPPLSIFFYFPIINLFAFLFVWMSIARRIQQPHWLGYFILVPGINVLLLWYLALVPAPAPEKRPEDIDTGIKFE